MTLSHDGTILYSNNRFGELLKEPTERIIGCDIYRFIAPTDTVSFESAFQSCWKGTRKVEILLKGEDGRLTPVYLSLCPLESDHVQCVCMVVMDLTERKRTETEIARARAELLRVERS